VLEPTVWRARAAAHEARVDAWLHGHLARRRLGVAHPVEDFLFTYYNYRPAHIRRWQPGIGVVLAGTDDVGPNYRHCDEGVTVDIAGFLARRYESVTWIRDLLVATAGRPPHVGCFGLHEWAMVYQQDQADVRHDAWPLRLGQTGTAAVVRESRIRCSHFDAFRFFTPSARPLNQWQPSRDTQREHEQPGCLHANMDVYRWAFKLSPLTSSDLVADCFELAREIRVLDMRASPYDLAGLGYQPVRIETAEGRAEYVTLQRGFAERAAVLRSRLIGVCTAALSDESVPGGVPSGPVNR
jgi:hypothetical protein